MNILYILGIGLGIGLLYAILSLLWKGKETTTPRDEEQDFRDWLWDCMKKKTDKED